MESPAVISFLTDYGTSDEFVGVCKSVIRQLAADAAVIDITHDIAPFDVRAGSLALVRAVQYLPDGVVLAVVDPGVATSRRAIAVRAGAQIFLGPDNGLLAPAVAMSGGADAAVELTNTDYHLNAPGPTFAGRDIFAPAAAYLCAGVSMHELGTPIDPATLLPSVLPLCRNEGDEVVGEVLWVDRFGNAQLNVGPDDIEQLGAVVELRFGDQRRTAHRAQTYGAIKGGSVGLVVDSYGLMSVCVDRGNASRELGLGETMAIALAVPGDDPRPTGDRRSVPVTLSRSNSPTG